MAHFHPLFLHPTLSSSLSKEFIPSTRFALSPFGVWDLHSLPLRLLFSHVGAVIIFLLVAVGNSVVVLP